MNPKRNRHLKRGRVDFEQHFPWGHAMFMKIAEPRIIRLLQFGIYICMIYAGYHVLANPPSSFETVLGATLVNVFGGFIAVGAVLGAIAVLPGIWWVERIGLIALITAMAIYVVVISTLGTSPLGIAVCVAFGLTFLQRWSEIRRFQLAPKEPRVG